MKGSIKVVSSDINTLGEIDLFNSLVFNKEYDDIDGMFQLYLGVTPKNVSLLSRGNMIMINNDSNKVGIIRQAKIDLDDKGNEVLMITGYSIENILNNRTAYISNTEKETMFIGNSAVLIEKLINENFIEPKNLDRKVDNLEVDIDESLGTDVMWQIKGDERIGDIISELCKVNQLGYKIYLDFNTKKLVFSLYKGRDLSNKVVFDPELDNIKNMRYVDSDLDYRNVSYVHITNEDMNIITEHRQSASKGLNRFEGFVSRNKLLEDEDAEGIADKYFANNELIQSIEGDIISTPLFTYGKDFNLGDIVTVKNSKWGVSKDLRITCISYVYEGNPKMSFVFGEPQPTLATKIKNYITNIRSDK